MLSEGLVHNAFRLRLTPFVTMLFPITRSLPRLALACLLALPASQALQASEQSSVREAVASGQYKPLAEILELVEKQMPGRIRILEVELQPDRLYGSVYEIELLDAQNRKREIKVHAETGQLVEVDDVPASVQPLASLPGILRNLLQQYPGYVEDVELEVGQNRQPVYEVKLIQADDRRLELVIDAATGEILRGLPSLEKAVGSMLSLPDILDAVLRQYPGLVLEAELERERNKSPDDWYYEIEIRQEDGRIVELHVDSHSARILREKFKD